MQTYKARYNTTRFTLDQQNNKKQKQIVNFSFTSKKQNENIKKLFVRVDASYNFIQVHKYILIQVHIKYNLSQQQLFTSNRQKLQKI